MKTVRMKWKGRAEESAVICRKHVLERGLARLPQLSSGNAILFTDSNVYALYEKKIKRHLPAVPVHVMPAGEEFKTAETLFALLRAMAEAGLKRNSLLIALGGGVVGDIGGLAASLYMRGISWVQVPTTLLAQVDSSVGGKTAIDFCGLKNLIGAFHQPQLTLTDPAFLATLPVRELRCGLGEIVKHAALSGALFEKLTAQDDLFSLDFLASVVPENIAFKASVVQRDPLETGLRKCLNLGHTTAHAIELTERVLSHGESVLIGIVYEAELARRTLSCDGEYLDRLITLCGRAAAVAPASVDVIHAAELAKMDKKNGSDGQIALTVPVRKGEYAELRLPYGEYARLLAEIKEALC